MPHFAASRASHRLDLSHRKTREVVMEDKVIIMKIEGVINHLTIQLGTQGERSQRLCFSSRENRRPMCRRKIINLTPNGSDFVEFSAVKANSFSHDHFSNYLFFQFVKVALIEASFLRHILFTMLLSHLCKHLVIHFLV